jgi:16S rRNA (cytidine1402-2'-O)-methyltransferase
MITGTLYIVATPIGNLEDITQRAISVLQSVDLIAAEDTRHSKVLLQRIQVSTPLVSYHDFSSDTAINKLLTELEHGSNVALISDAGTPLISDPGYRLVKLARERGIGVLPIPGASALTAALSVAGLATDRFVFEGFLPSKAAARLARLREFQLETRSVIFYESTHRIVESIAAMCEVFGPSRRVFIGRELTKKFESHCNASLADSLQWLQADSNQQKGEFVIVLDGCDAEQLQQHHETRALELVQRLRRDMPMKSAVTLASELTGAKKNALYQRVLAADGEGGD